MTHNEYELTKRRLEEARRSGIELVEAAFEAQMRALEMVWMLQGGSAAAPVFASEAPAAEAVAQVAPEAPRKRSFDEVDDAVRAALSRLPESFTRRDVCQALGYEPDRGSLYRCLETLTKEGHLRIEQKGEGQRATVYRRAGAGSSPG